MGPVSPDETPEQIWWTATKHDRAPVQGPLGAAREVLCKTLAGQQSPGRRPPSCISGEAPPSHTGPACTHEQAMESSVVPAGQSRSQSEPQLATDDAVPNTSTQAK